MKPKRFKLIVYLIIGILVAAFVFFWVESKKSGGLISFINTISGISSFFVAILTALNVYTTSSQIEIANRQLDEMSLERVSRETPLLSLNDISLEIEVPRLYYTPPTDEIGVFSRYHLHLKLSNDTPFSAIAINVGAEIQIEGEEGKHLQAFSRSIDIVSANSTTEDISLLLPGEDRCENGCLLETLRQGDIHRIRIIVTLFYKSLSGGFYKESKQLYLCLHPESEPTIKKWHIAISGADVMYKEQLEHLKSLDKHGRAWDKAFRSYRHEIEGRFVNDKKINIPCEDYPGSFDMEIISKDAYIAELEEHKYPDSVKAFLEEQEQTSN